MIAITYLRGLVAIAAFGCIACEAEKSQNTELDSEYVEPFEGTAWAGVTKFTCRPELQSSCGSKNCESAPAGREVFIEIDLSEETYRRCNSAGCNSLKATTGWDGTAMNVAMLNDGYFLRVTGQGRFIDSAPFLGASTVMHFGNCTPN